MLLKSHSKDCISSFILESTEALFKKPYLAAKFYKIMFKVWLKITFQMSHLQNVAGSSMNHQHVILLLHLCFMQTKEIPEPSVLLGLLL